MAQTGYTPISIYYSSTAAATPTAGNLVAGELAINTADGKLFYKDSAGVVQVIGTKGGVGSSTTTQVLYNSSGLVVGSANMTFSGTALTLANDASISGLKVGKGAGSDAYSTALGALAINANTTGTQNSGAGWASLFANTTGSSNSGFGYGTLFTNTTGGSNTAIGTSALYSNTTASNNTAVGYQAGYSNTTGNNSVMLGRLAGYSATISAQNTFIGANAGYSSNVTAGGNGYNTFVGYAAGYSSTTGYNNTFVGSNGNGTGAGHYVTTGIANTILGAYNGNQGGLDIRTASNWIVLSDGDGTPRIVHNAGGTYGYFAVASVYNNTTANAANVWVDSGGTMWRSTSSLKYKKDVENATHGLAEVMQLRPVTYRQKNTDSNGLEITQKFGGLIAEEVDALGLSEFVQYADDGSPDSLAYGNMVSLLVKAVQELKLEFEAYKASHP